MMRTPEDFLFASYVNIIASSYLNQLVQVYWSIIDQHAAQV